MRSSVGYHSDQAHAYPSSRVHRNSALNCNRRLLASMDTVSADMADFLRGRGGGSDHHQQHNIKGHLERQQDGSVLFKVVFDVAGYSPEDLRTVLVGDRTVQVGGRATLEDRATGKHTSISFEEHFALPDNVDSSQLRSVVSNGQLVVIAPVLPPQYPARPAAATAAATAVVDSLGGSGGIKSLRHQQQQQQQQQQQAQQHQSSPKSTSPTPYNLHSIGQQLQQSPQSPQPPQPPHPPPHPHNHNQQQQQQQSVVKRYNVFQLEIDPGLDFAPSDLKISTAGAGSRLVVHGQRQVRSQGKTSFREFRDEFDLPQGLDLAKMTARLRSDGRVFVEAPFKADSDAASAGGFTFQTLPVLHR